jgi:hypothetical protein
MSSSESVSSHLARGSAATLRGGFDVLGSDELRRVPKQTVRAQVVVGWWRDLVGGSRRQTDHERRRPALR